MTKPGYKTTEFWLSAAAALMGVLFASGVIPAEGVWPQVAGVVASALTAAGYSVARGVAKAQ